MKIIIHSLFVVLTLFFLNAATAQTSTLLNVSYDVAREFYKDIDAAFEADYKKNTGKDVHINQSHAGTSTQARAVADGLDADVVTFNTASDIDFLASKGLVAQDWRNKFPNQAAPTTSTMLFLVRKGNPKNIKDWNDLIAPDIKIIVVNPKTGGNGRMAYLAAWGQVLAKGGNAAQAQQYVSDFYKRVPVLAKGGREATGMFLQRNIGDVLITFESEVISVDREFGSGKVDVVYPSSSIIAENPVAVIERTVNKRGTAQLAKAYLDFLYTPQAQKIAAEHYIRPHDESVLKSYPQFKPLKLFSIQQYFGSLSQAQKEHFDDGGKFDQIFAAAKHP